MIGKQWLKHGRTLGCRVTSMAALKHFKKNPPDSCLFSNYNLLFKAASFRSNLQALRGLRATAWCTATENDLNNVLRRCSSDCFSVFHSRCSLLPLPAPLFFAVSVSNPASSGCHKSRQITWGDFTLSPSNGALTPPPPLALAELPASAHAARELLVAVSSASLKWWRARRGASSSLEGDSSKPFQWGKEV